MCVSPNLKLAHHLKSCDPRSLSLYLQSLIPHLSLSLSLSAIQAVRTAGAGRGQAQLAFIAKIPRLAGDALGDVRPNQRPVLAPLCYKHCKAVTQQCIDSSTACLAGRAALCYCLSDRLSRGWRGVKRRLKFDLIS